MPGKLNIGIFKILILLLLVVVQVVYLTNHSTETW